MITFTHVIEDIEGLHARPVALICAAARDFESAVSVTRAGETVPATDLMGLMGLNAQRGEELSVSIEGLDEAACAEKMREVFTF